MIIESIELHPPFLVVKARLSVLIFGILKHLELEVEFELQ
jgi:hypothetical protein